MIKKTIFSVLCVVVLLFPAFAYAQSYPEPTGFVNDTANVIDQQVEAQLESQLKSYEEQTGNEIAVLTVQTLEGIPIEEYAVELFERWGIGKEGEDNGVLFLVASEDRKMRIEVGYGLEGDVTDAYSKRILENDVRPYLADDNFSDGIYAGVQSIMGVISGDIVLEDEPTSGGELVGGLISGFFNFFGGFFQFLIFALVIYTLSKRRNGRGGPPIFFGGGGFGGGSSGGFGGFGGGSSGGGGASSDF